MQSDRQARIRERAYQIWVEEGRVHGKEDEHWRRAERELADEEGGAAKPAKPAKPRAGAARSTPAAKAEAAKIMSRGRRQSVDKPVS